MSLYVSPIGFAIAFVIWLVLGVTILGPVWKRLQHKPHRWRLFGPLVAIVVVLPYADELWIAWHFHQRCKDAGVHVLRKVEVEGFYDSTMHSGYELINRVGYRFMEQPAEEKGKVDHIEKPGGTWKKTVLDRPTARYVYRFADERQAVPAGFQLEKWEMQVVDTESGEVIGTDVHFHRYPGLIEGLWVRFFGSGRVICEGSAPKPPQLRYSLYYYVLIPKKQK